MCLNKAKYDGEPTLSYSIGLPSPPKFVTVVHGSFYKFLYSCSEPCSVQRRLSFIVEVTTASRNWAPASLENIFFSARFQWLLRSRNGGHLTPPTLRIQ